MFAPNKYNISVPNTKFHHRGEDFMKLYENFEELFRKTFKISSKYGILIYNGSGSQTIEKVIQSLDFKLIHPHNEGKFESRWKDMTEYYNKNNSKDSNNLIVQFETSISKNRSADNSYLIDAVCAFPYYSLPKDFKILVTVSSKLIGAAPVVGIILYDEHIVKDLDTTVPGGLADWIKYSKISQTPYTPSISLIESLVKELRGFKIDDLIYKINYVSKLILDIVGPEGIYGDEKGPAISIKKEYVNLDRCKQLQIYGMHTNNDFVQIFTYSEAIERYKLILPQILINHKSITNQSQIK